MTMIMMTENLTTKTTTSNPQVPSADTMKLRKTFKNMGNVLAKIMKKSIFSKIKLAGLLMKKRASFSTKICPVF